jgi:hypothetical protein
MYPLLDNGCFMVKIQKRKGKARLLWLCQCVSVFKRPNNIQWSFQNVNFLIMQLPSFSCYFLPLRSEYFWSRFPCQNTWKREWLCVIQETKLKHISLAFSGGDFRLLRRQIWRLRVFCHRGTKFSKDPAAYISNILPWTRCLHQQGIGLNMLHPPPVYYTEDGSSRLFRNFGIYLSNYMGTQPRK